MAATIPADWLPLNFLALLPVRVKEAWRCEPVTVSAPIHPPNRPSAWLQSGNALASCWQRFSSFSLETSRCNFSEF
jgi:hypothetical protein